MIGSVSTATNGVALSAQKDGLTKAAKQFEAVFVRQMLGAMRQAGLGEDVLGSDASNQFRDMQDGKLADSIADSNGFGIADMLLKQFSASPAAAASALGTTPSPASADAASAQAAASAQEFPS